MIVAMICFHATSITHHSLYMCIVGNVGIRFNEEEECLESKKEDISGCKSFISATLDLCMCSVFRIELFSPHSHHNTFTLWVKTPSKVCREADLQEASQETLQSLILNTDCIQ